MTLLIKNKQWLVKERTEKKSWWHLQAETWLAKIVKNLRWNTLWIKKIKLFSASFLFLSLLSPIPSSLSLSLSLVICLVWHSGQRLLTSFSFTFLLSLSLTYLSLCLSLCPSPSLSLPSLSLFSKSSTSASSYIPPCLSLSLSLSMLFALPRPQVAYPLVFRTLSLFLSFFLPLSLSIICLIWYTRFTLSLSLSVLYYEIDLWSNCFENTSSH